MLRKLFNHALLVLTMYHHGKTVCLQRAVNGKRRSWSPDPWAYTVAPQKCRFATFSINILNVQEDQGSIELLIGGRGWGRGDDIGISKLQLLRCSHCHFCRRHPLRFLTDLAISGVIAPVTTSPYRDFRHAG